MNTQVEVQGCPHPCAYILWLHGALRRCKTKYVPKKPAAIPTSDFPALPPLPPLPPLQAPPEASEDVATSTETAAPETAALQTPEKSSSAPPDNEAVQADANPSSNAQVEFAFGDKVVGIADPHAGEVGVIISQSKIVKDRYTVQWVTAKVGDFKSCDVTFLQVSYRGYQ